MSREQEIIAIITELADELGWIVAIPDAGDTIPGLILGTEEFILDISQSGALDLENESDDDEDSGVRH